MVGPVPAYIVGGALLCIAAGWYAGYRNREAEQGRPAFGYWPTYVLAAFAAGAFAVWGANLTAAVHTPEASLAAATDPTNPSPQEPTTVTTEASPVPRPGTCAAGSAEACSNVLLLIQTTTDTFAANLRSTCQALVNAAANPQTAGWSPPTELARDCTFWLQGGGQVRGIEAERTEAHRLFNELATYAGWPPPNR
jgi:hypothetical protein